MKTARSRRDRPAKPALTRQGIIDAALAVMRAEGLGKATMRRIADALDTGPASLYVYVRNTEDLHAQILDALLGSLSPPAAAGTWRGRLHAVLEGYMALLRRYPELARMAMSTMPSGPHYLALVERLLALLAEGGIPDRQAAWGVDLLLLHATANALEKAEWGRSERFDGEFSALTEAVASVDATTHPNLARLGGGLMTGGPARGAWQLDVLLNGLAGTPLED